MTHKERRTLALAHFGLTEADVVETVRVHKGTKHRLFPANYCYRCDAIFSGEETERVVMKAGRIVVRVDE